MTVSTVSVVSVTEKLLGSSGQRLPVFQVLHSLDCQALDDGQRVTVPLRHLGEPKNLLQYLFGRGAWLPFLLGTREFEIVLYHKFPLAGTRLHGRSASRLNYRGY